MKNNSLIISGTGRPNSRTSIVADKIQAILSSLDSESKIIQPSNLSLPIYTPNIELSKEQNDPLQMFVEHIRLCGAIFVISPVYGDCLSAMIKNLFEHATGNAGPYLIGKPVGLVSVSESSDGYGSIASLNLMARGVGMTPVAGGLCFSSRDFRGSDLTPWALSRLSILISDVRYYMDRGADSHA